MTFLSDILETKREEIATLRSLEDYISQVRSHPRSDIRTPTWSDSLDVIAEIKRRSPSKGHLAHIEEPSELGATYEEHGAGIISVLTDEKHFGAKRDDLLRVRDAVSIPILRKDFVIDLRQVFETYFLGADIMLLIVAAFENFDDMKTIYDMAIELGLGVIVETHSAEELEVAHALGAEIIGVNVRDLATFDEEPDRGAAMISTISKPTVSVWESSIVTLADAQRARSAGADCVLVGQGLVQHDDPGAFIAQMRDIS